MSMCREKLRQSGQQYPRSNCAKCGPLTRPGWRCPEDTLEERQVDVVVDDGYLVIPPIPNAKAVIKGVKCGECGIKFNYGEPYSLSCPNNRCPIDFKVF